jgi:catechol 2,3-dioxygenase-like lactoylglutathione lyase family enzyme
MFSGMNPKTLDHVALWVADRDAIAGFVTRHLGMHEIDRTDAFTLVGSNARRGKLTLFAAEGPRERGALEHVALRVNDLRAALALLPEGLELDQPRPGEAYFDVAEGLRLGLVEAETDVDYDLDHVALTSADPAAALEGWIELGLSPYGDHRVEVGGAFVELRPGGNGAEPERPLLNHLAVLVDSAAEAEEAGYDVERVVDAANTFAVFVWGPERVRLEYVEHKPSFSLT